jgi:hypothetical protein
MAIKASKSLNEAEFKMSRQRIRNNFNCYIKKAIKVMLVCSFIMSKGGASDFVHRDI